MGDNGFYTDPESGSGAKIPPKAAAFIAYFFSLPGCLVTYLIGGRENPFVKFHLNQAIVLGVLSLLVRIVDVGDVISAAVTIFTFFGWIVGVYGAVTGKMTEIPLISKVRILN